MHADGGCGCGGGGGCAGQCHILCQMIACAPNAVTTEGSRPRRFDGCRAQGQRGRCPSMFRFRYWCRNRHGGMSAPATLCARGKRATRPLPLHAYGASRRIWPALALYVFLSLLTSGCVSFMLFMSFMVISTCSNRRKVLTDLSHNVMGCGVYAHACSHGSQACQYVIQHSKPDARRGCVNDLRTLRRTHQRSSAFIPVSLLRDATTQQPSATQYRKSLRRNNLHNCVSHCISRL